MTQGTGVNAPRVVVVTVTYGSRWSLLRRALQSARNEGACHAIVVDNASAEDIGGLAEAEFGGFVRVVRHERNLGSAGGFKRGLQEALRTDTEFIFLLDDDNELQAGCIGALQREHRRWLADVPAESLVMLAHRPDHQLDVAAGTAPLQVAPPPGSFFGFTIFDLPAKLWHRLGLNRQRGLSSATAPTHVMETAPYSGMYFHRSAVDAHGLPNEQLVLYADDTEFSHRLSAHGGKIVLVTAAGVRDMERSWNVKTQFSGALESWLLGGSDLRAYYAARNHAYWERHCRAGHGALRSFNRSVYLLMLRVRAWQLGRTRRFRLLLSAIRDGESQRLGQHALYPL
jgi:GT2 family glycosyltransferase